MREVSIDEEVKKAVESFGEPPRIILTGKTGAGKSSLVNALLGKECQKTDVVPCTMADNELHWNTGGAELKLVDVPGFAEADKHGERVQFILNHLPEAHLGLLVIPAPDRALEHERQFLEDVRSTDADFPIVTIGNKIDMINPVRDWAPKALNLRKPATQKETNIATWADYLKNTCGVTDSRFALVASGECFDQSEQQYGLDDLTQMIVDALPDAVRNQAARAFNVLKIKQARAEKVIYAAAVAAAVAALIPIPVAHAAAITSVQLGMVVTIACLFGLKLDARQAAGLIGPALAYFAGPMVFQEFLLLLPGVGSALSASLAGAITWAIGMTYMHFYIAGNFNPSASEVKEILKEKYAEAKNMKVQLEREARAKAA